MMYKKVSKHVADICDPKTYHPVNDVKDVERFKPLCIIEKKKNIGFWKKASMNPTSLSLNDLLVTKDFQISINKTEYTLPNDDGGGEESIIKLGNSIASKIASENEFEYASGDKMNLVFNLLLEKNEVSYEQVLEVIQDNPLDELHPLYLYAKCPKNPMCLVTETISTQGECTPDNEHVISPLADAETSTGSTITADIYGKGSTEKKYSHTYEISPGTVLAYSCIEFIAESNGIIRLQGIPITLDDCKDTPEHTLQPETCEVKETEDENVQETENMDADVNKAEDDAVTETVEDDEITDEDLEVPIIIRDINQDDPIVQIKGELEPLLQLGYFGKLQAEIKTLLNKASEKDFQLIYLLLYRANLYIGNNTGDKFITLANLEELIGDETKFTWKTVMNRIGFSVPKDANDPKACVTFPKKDDRGVLQAFMGVIGSIINVNAEVRKLISNITVEHVKIIFHIIEMQLQNISTFVSDPIVEAMLSKDPITMELLTFCGFSKSLEDENMLSFTKENQYMLLDVYAVLSMICAGKKPFLKSSSSFSKEKKRASLLPRISSFRRQKSIESQNNVDMPIDDKLCSTTTPDQTIEDKLNNMDSTPEDNNTNNANTTENVPTTEL